MKARLFIVILGVLSGICLHAQPKWTLEQCIQYAWEHNLQMQTKQISMQSSRLTKDATRLNFVPDLGLRADYQFSQAAASAPLHSVSSGLYLSTTLFDGLQKYYNYRKAHSDWQVAQWDVAYAKDQIALSVMSQYINVLMCKEAVCSAQEQINKSNTSIERAKMLIKEGVWTDEQLQNLLIQLSNEMYALADAEGNLKTAMIGLCSLLNRTDYNTMEVIDSLPNAPIKEQRSLSRIIDVALTMPQISLSHQQITSAKYALNLAKSNYYPTLSLNASLSSSFIDKRQPYPFFDQMKDYRNSIISLNLSIPLFSHWQTRKSVSIARNNLKLSQLELLSAEKALIEEIVRVYSEMEISKQRYMSSKKAVEHTQKVLSYIDNKLANGTVVISDYMVAKSNLLITQAQLTRAKYEYILRQRVLNFYEFHK